MMTEIILKYQGTIDEFIGDAILAIFGAPTQRDDDAQRAVACALEMQIAMEEVNILAEKNVSDDLYDGKRVKLLTSVAEIEADIAVEKLSNLKIILFDAAGREVTSDLYAKVTEVLSPSRFRVAFTSMLPVVKVFLEQFLANTNSELKRD